MKWEKVKLKELIKIKNGKDHKPLKNGKYPVYGSGGLIRYVDKFLYDRESVLLPRKGTLNNIQYAGSPFWTVDTCYYTEINTNRVIPYFLFRNLRQFNIEALNTGSAIPSMTFDRYYSIQVSLPSIDIQQKIVDILKPYDDLIENNQKQIKLLEEAAQRLYKEWFVDFRFPGYENAKFIDGIPEGWRKAKLNDVLAKITTGLNPRKNFVLGSGENYYVTIKNMKDNNIYLDDKCDRIDDEALIKINKRSDLQKGDILFSGIGTMGRVYLIGIPTDNWNVSESVFTMRANDNISKEMLYLLLLSPDMQGYCDTHAHGVAQRGIRMADIKNYQFYLPVSEIIENFTNNAKPFTKKIQILQRQNILLTQARDRLLPKLMSGEIEV